MTRARPVSICLCLVAVLLLVPHTAMASDHADPMTLTRLEAGITGLFAFPRGDQLVVILTARRNLTAPGPYDLEPFEYTIYMDLTSEVGYRNNAEDRARYGGTVINPEGITENVTIRFRLTDDANLQRGYPLIEGLGNPDAISVYAGVRDDPFIFHRFFDKNVIAMALRIPFSLFPAGQQDWLLWATTARARNGRQIDHVGRSNRTQLARFDFLNTIPPNEHVAAITRRYNRGLSIRGGLMHLMEYFAPVGGLSSLYEYLLQIRPYDLEPDVMIFTTRVPPGFPNGRRLKDDIVGLTCAQGDCALQEVAFIEGGWPRATTNDKPFLDEFPYLAEPHAEQPEERPVDLVALIFWPAVLIIGVGLVLYARRRQRLAELPWVRPAVGR